MEEKVIISPLHHEHPLILKENVSMRAKNCFGCKNPIADLEIGYACMEHDCSSRDMIMYHKKCGELPSEIRHPKHPLKLFRFYEYMHHNCDVCGRELSGGLLGYRCRSCDFSLDAECEKVCIDALREGRKELEHPSHPQHLLTLMRKHPFSFYCDGCGDRDVDLAYICSTCEFWLHKGCALLPLIHEVHHLHHHRLSLAFSFPEEHRKFKYKCEVCDKYIGRACWVYYCGDCRYFVHIKCINEVGSTTKNIQDYSNKEVIEFPLHTNDISTNLITPFVTREKGVEVDNTTSSSSSNSSFLLEYFHEHPLSLVSKFTHEDEDEDEDKDKESKICDVCITPISSSTPYYECAPCSYFIHSICSSIPHTLCSSSSRSSLLQLYGSCNPMLTHNKNHNFTLFKSKGSRILYWYCNFCRLPTNGMGYECRDCRMKIDVKCASLPFTIQHLSHHPRHHKPLILTVVSSPFPTKFCYGCQSTIPYYYNNNTFCCSHDGCDFALHFKCAQLPLSVTERERDKHPLMLTFDASRDHPSDFFCEFCESEMHPKDWMYHCRQCDASFHPDCLNTGSGEYRNMKLGGRYVIDGTHHPNHPLTFTCVTLKKRCDLCLQYWFVYTYLGFECASCYFVVCHDCGVRKLNEKKLRLC